MFTVLVALFGLTAGLVAGVATTGTLAAAIPVDATFASMFSLWLANWWAKFRSLRILRRRAAVARATTTDPTDTAEPEDPEEVPPELQQLASDVSKLLKVSVAASAVVAALIIVRVLGILLKRRVVQKETVDRGLTRLFRIFEWIADFGFITLFFWGNGKEEFAALQRVLGVLRRMCFKQGTFNIDIPDSMLHGVGLGSYAGTWNRLKRNRWRVVAVLVAVIALSVVTARAWKKVNKKGGISSFIASLFGSGDVETEVSVEKKRKVKRKGQYMGSGDGDGNKGRKVSDDGPHAYDPEQIHALPPFRLDSSGEIPLYHKDGTSRAMAGAVSHEGKPMVVSIAHAVRDGGAYWDTAGQQPVVVIRFMNEDKNDAIAVLKAPATLPRAAKTGAMTVAHAAAMLWKQGEVSAGNIFQMDEGTLRHTCGTLPGHSGSLIFAFIGGKWVAVGVHASATSSHNVAYSFF